MSRWEILGVVHFGNYIQGDSEESSSSSYPFVPPPPSGPLRHSGASRNPEDTFPLDLDFRRGDERGRPAEAGLHPLDSRFHGNDDRVGSSSYGIPFIFDVAGGGTLSLALPQGGRGQKKEG